MTTDPTPSPTQPSIYQGTPRDPDTGMEVISIVLGGIAIVLGGLTLLSMIATFFGNSNVGFGYTYNARGFSLSTTQRIQSLAPVISSVGTVPLLVALGALITGRRTGRLIGVVAVGIVLAAIALALLRSQTTFTI